MTESIDSQARRGLVVEACTDPAAWDAYVEAHPDASGYHLWAWRGIFEGVFRHRTHYLAAQRGGRITGVLPLVFFQSPIFGRFVVSVPFLNYGGVVADDEAAAAALVEHAGRLAREHKATHVELRHDRRRFPHLVPKEHKVAMTLALPGDADALWAALDRKVRNQVRKAEKSGLTAEAGGSEHLRDFYGVFATNMRDLGTPVYSPRLFEAVLATFPERTRIVVVRHEGRAAAAGLTWRWRERTEVPWASSLREFNQMSPNNLLYWTILREAIAAGCTRLDFGRSTPNEGTFHFKKQWGAEPTPLCWEYDVVTGTLPDQSPKNPKFRLAIQAWQKLPVGIANVFGPPIVRSIP
ncbi:MAG: FemAB family XrtA/PEP-CTERM system-associated protein [Vicinamibacterales bacterium]